jgi:hypothetical protein
MKTPIVQSATALPDYQVELLFDNGEKRLFDMTPYLNFGVFAELEDQELFKTVRVVFDSIEWANGADLCPEALYDKSLPAGSNMIVAEDPGTSYGREEHD